MPEKPIPIKFKVTFEKTPEKHVSLQALAFNSQGELIASGPVDKDGQAELSLTESQAKGARILFVPDIKSRTDKPPTIETLQRMRAYEAPFTINPQASIQEVLPIPAAISKYWIWCPCRVRGHVVKPIPVDGASQDMPVCNARVHICEVESFLDLIEDWEDSIIFRLRDEWLAIIDQPFIPPHILPDPPPYFRYDPRVVDPSPQNVAKMQPRAKVGLQSPGSLVAFNPQPDPPAVTAELSRIAASTAKVSRSASIATSVAPLSASLSLEARAAVSSTSANTVRRALKQNVAVLLPYLCYFPWLYWWWACEDEAVTTTDQYGRFDTTIWYECEDGPPNLYIWVEYFLNGAWTTVYHPPLWCNVYWAFACGTDVTIRVTDPRVPWCGNPTLPGKVVAVNSIGNNISMTQIQRQPAGATEGLTSNGEPFGGSLEPHAFFGADALIAAGITHYKWSYRKIGSPGWSVMSRKVVRHYAVLAGTDLFYFPLLLGPDPALAGMNLFKIQPKDPPPGSLGWVILDAHEDTANGFFESHLENGGDAELSQGNYELKLELFKAAAPGIPVNFTTEGILLKVPTVDAPFGAGTVPTRTVPHDPAHPLDDMDDRVFKDGGGNVVGFRLVLHVDNSVCSGWMNDVTVNANPAGPCGFISYPPGSSALIHFHAGHPHDFAKYTFEVVRGSSGRVEVACAPSPASSYPALPLVTVAANGFTRDVSSNFTKFVPIDNGNPAQDLVGTCTDGKAAFAEALNVYAMAIDGWERLYWLDANPTIKAFALEPA